MAVRWANYLLLSTTLPLVGCGIGGQASEYNFSCPSTALQQIDLLDVSASGRDERLLAARLDAMQVDSERVADCEGRFTAVAWSESSATSTVLFSGAVPTAGASEIGRDRKIPEAVDVVMGEIRGSLNDLFATNPPTGHDLVAAFSIISDAVRSQATADVTPVVHVYADGISTVGPGNINRSFLTDAQLDEIIAAQSLPDLTGVEIDVYGVGRVGGVDQPPQQVVALVTAYVQRLCDATGATCSVYTSNL